MNNRKPLIMIILSVLMLALAAYLLYYSLRPPKEPSAADQAEPPVPSPSSQVSQSSGGSGSGGNQQTGAKEPVTKFILAVANPSKQLTTDADKKAAMQYLSKSLQDKVAAEYGNDPSKLLDVLRPQSFVVADPRNATRGATVEVDFKLPTSEETRLFSVEQQNGQWVITGIQTPNQR